MGLTDEQVAAMGGQIAPDAAPAPRAPRGALRAPKQKAVELSQGDYDKAQERVNRLNDLSHTFGVTADDETGAVALDHDLSDSFTRGYHPDVVNAVNKKFALETRKVAAEKDGDVKKALGLEQERVGFPDFEERNLGFTPADPKKKAQALRAWTAVQKLVLADGNKAGGDPTQYLFSADAGPAVKAEVRRQIAQRFRDELRLLPAQGGGDKAREHFEKIAKYIETLDPALLAPHSQTLSGVQDLSKHVSGPVRAAVDNAVREQADPERSSILDALKTGFGNNVAPLTMGLGSMVAKATGPAEGTRAAAGNVGQNVDQMHQAIVQGLTGKTPEQQAEFIDQLKREHPIAYHAAAAAGWIADPVGLLGGKLVQGAKRLGQAAGLGWAATPAAVAAVGAPTGVLAGRAAGSEDDALNAGLGAAGEAGGQLMGAAARKLGGVAAGAPARVATRDLNTAANRIAHTIGEAETAAMNPANPLGTARRHMGMGEFQKIYHDLAQEFPDLAAIKDVPVPADPITGRAVPARNRQLSDAAHKAIENARSSGHGNPNGNPSRPFVNLVDPHVSMAVKLRSGFQEAMEGRPGRALTAGLGGMAPKLASQVDRGVAKLVQAIRSGDHEVFHAAISQARHEGVAAPMIDAATAAFHRRNSREADE